jgi:hypothetical protein
VAEEALAADGAAWEAFAGLLSGIVEADVHSLTVRLAGTFTPTQELGELAETASRLTTRRFRRAGNAELGERWATR